MLETEEIISKFYEVIKVKYPDVTYEELNVICRAPFHFLRKQMSRIELPDIRFKYWGVFKVKQGRLNTVVGITEKTTAGRMSVKKRERYKAIIETHNLNSNNDEQS